MIIYPIVSKLSKFFITITNSFHEFYHKMYRNLCAKNLVSLIKISTHTKNITPNNFFLSDINLSVDPVKHEFFFQHDFFSNYLTAFLVFTFLLQKLAHFFKEDPHVIKEKKTKERLQKNDLTDIALLSLGVLVVSVTLVRVVVLGVTVVSSVLANNTPNIPHSFVVLPPNKDSFVVLPPNKDSFVVLPKPTENIPVLSSPAELPVKLEFFEYLFTSHPYIPYILFAIFCGFFAGFLFYYFCMFYNGFIVLSRMGKNLTVNKIFKIIKT